MASTAARANVATVELRVRPTMTPRAAGPRSAHRVRQTRARGRRRRCRDLAHEALDVGPTLESPFTRCAATARRRQRQATDLRARQRTAARRFSTPTVGEENLLDLAPVRPPRRDKQHEVALTIGSRRCWAQVGSPEECGSADHGLRDRDCRAEQGWVGVPRTPRSMTVPRQALPAARRAVAAVRRPTQRSNVESSVRLALLLCPDVRVPTCEMLDRRNESTVPNRIVRRAARARSPS